MTVNIITIGDEILIGQIVDTNSAWMAQQLNLIGATVTEIVSIKDTPETIHEALQNALDKADVILITGGLGPTKDDVTKKAIAHFLGMEMVFHEATWERIQRLFQRWGRSTTPAHRQQSYMPSGAKLLHNKMGTAPGMWFEKADKVIVSMPGVPFEMKYLMEYEVLPKLQEHFPGKPIAHRTIQTVGEGESRISARIESFEENLPQNIKLAYLPGMGRVRLRLTATGQNGEDLNDILDSKVKEIESLIPEFIFGYEKDSLEATIGQMLKARGLYLSTAESCTGGYLAHQITTVPGSSAYFTGSIIAYSNEVKMNVLSVKPSTLEQYGAVSEQTVIEMVAGALKTIKADIAISISGIAGPDGGTPEKPVGTIWLAIGNKDTTQTFKLQLGKDRLRNIQYTSVKALDMIRLFLKQHYPLAQSILEKPF